MPPPLQCQGASWRESKRLGLLSESWVAFAFQKYSRESTFLLRPTQSPSQTDRQTGQTALGSSSLRVLAVSRHCNKNVKILATSGRLKGCLTRCLWHIYHAIVDNNNNSSKSTKEAATSATTSAEVHQVATVAAAGFKMLRFKLGN